MDAATTREGTAITETVEGTATTDKAEEMATTELLAGVDTIAQVRCVPEEMDTTEYHRPTLESAGCSKG